MALSLRKKLLILTITPLVLLTAMGGFLVFQNWQNLKRLNEADESFRLLSSLSRLVNAAQKERSISSLVLNGGALPNQLPELRKATRDAWAAVEPMLADSAVPDWLVTDTGVAITNLDSLRLSIDDRSLLDRSSFASFSGIIGKMLDCMKFATQIEAPGVAPFFTRILLFEDTKEYAAEVGAMVGSTYSLDLPLLDTQVFELLNMGAALNANLASRVYVASPEIEMKLAEMVAGEDWLELQDDLMFLLDNYSRGGFGRDSDAAVSRTNKVVKAIQGIIDQATDEATAFVDARKRELIKTTVLIAAVVAGIVLAMMIQSLLIMASLVSRLKQVGSGMREIASGDADLTRTIPKGLDDELGALAENFNSFTGTLRTLIDKIKQEAAQLEAGVERLVSNTEETAGAVRQIAANIDSLKQQTISQSASVTESSATIEQIVKNIGILYRQIERQAEGVSTSSSSIEEMVANIQSVTANIQRMGAYYDKLLGKSDTGRTAIGTVVSQVREIDTQSASLQEANMLIAGIASQTNLLAMNAAIEAAHAGEAGQGFAVVADEIRKLAENAARQSKTISQNIKSIRALINAVVDSSGTSAHTFEEIVEQIQVLSRLEEEIKYAMQEQSTGSVQILDSLAGINSVTTDVRQSAQEMQEGSNTVLLEMRRLLQLAGELENGMSEMAAGADEIRRAAHDTNDLSGDAAHSVKQLMDEAAKFKT